MTCVMDSQPSELVNRVWPPYDLHSWLGTKYKVSSWLPGKTVTTSDAEAAWDCRPFHVDVSRSYQLELRTFMLSFRQVNAFFTALKKNFHCSLEGKIVFLWLVLGGEKHSLRVEGGLRNVLRVKLKVKWRTGDGKSMRDIKTRLDDYWYDVTSLFFTTLSKNRFVSCHGIFISVCELYGVACFNSKGESNPTPTWVLNIYSSWCYPLKLAGS